jgi:hypothetical protein
VSPDWARCPDRCKNDWLTVWISLFGVFIGLTLASIAFIAAYVLFTKVQYKKMEKKLVINSSTQSN